MQHALYQTIVHFLAVGGVPGDIRFLTCLMAYDASAANDCHRTHGQGFISPFATLISALPNRQFPWRRRGKNRSGYRDMFGDGTCMVASALAGSFGPDCTDMAGIRSRVTSTSLPDTCPGPSTVVRGHRREPPGRGGFRNRSDDVAAPLKEGRVHGDGFSGEPDRLMPLITVRMSPTSGGASSEWSVIAQLRIPCPALQTSRRVAANGGGLFDTGLSGAGSTAVLARVVRRSSSVTASTAKVAVPV